jgi:hypothetical protein
MNAIPCLEVINLQAGGQATIRIVPAPTGAR